MPKPAAATFRKPRPGSPKRWSGSSSKPARKPALWTKAFPRQVKPRASAGARRRSVRSIEQEQYRKHAKIWITGKICTCVGVTGQDGKPSCKLWKHAATEVHHFKGRAGSLLLDQRHWIPVCRDAHRWIHENIEYARGIRLIATAGQWNRQ